MIGEAAEEKGRYSNTSEARVRDHLKGCGSGGRGQLEWGNVRRGSVPTRTDSYMQRGRRQVRE